MRQAANWRRKLWDDKLKGRGFEISQRLKQRREVFRRQL